ncbi:MAG TPA: hypothetical protein VHH36_06605 [Candidatus Thermoplasmatota archaeon]|nr:hypothetical protein [Candidatus Thermoplasmatota archaeon]
MPKAPTPGKPPYNERPAEQPASPKEPSPVRPPGEPTPKEGPRQESGGEPADEPEVEGG